MKIRNVLVIPFLLLVLTAVSCGNSKSRNDRTETVDKEVIKAPEFDADSAYQYIQVQADFGPRVPNTQAHKECGEYLAGQLEKFGAKVYNQYADLIAYDGTILKSRNIIGAYKPESKKRILLCAVSLTRRRTKNVGNTWQDNWKYSEPRYTINMLI
mgnify:CR=1 FL=1